MKECSLCLKIKNICDFYPNPRNKEGIYKHCKECHKVYRNNWIEKNKNKYGSYYRKSFLKKKYGVTPEWYETTMISQNEKCAICGNDKPDKRSNKLFIDHNHVTGKVRGLLCSLCNTGLGNFKDNQLLLKNAIKYLIKHEKIK